MRAPFGNLFRDRVPMNQEVNSEIDAVISFPECGVELTCLIRQVKDDIFRICEHPTFVEDQVAYGDCARMLKIDDQNYEFQEITSKSGLNFVQYFINDEIFLEIAGILDKTQRSKGYWQRDFGGILSLYFDAEIFDPRSDLETLFK